MPAAGVGAGVIIVAIGAVLYLGRPVQNIEPDMEPQQVAVVPEVDPEVETGAAPAESEESVPTPVQIAPAFDLVRIPPEGLATVAGRAEPGSTVHILVDGSEVAKADANDRGEFVALFDLEASETPREMQLVSGTGDAAQSSAESVIVAPVPNSGIVEGADADVMVADESTDDEEVATANGGAPMASASAGSAIAGKILDAQPPKQPTVLMADDEGVKVLQQEGTAQAELRIDAVSYDPEGRVFVSGRAAPGTTLRFYLDDTYTTRTAADADGQWREELKDVAAGRYTLRADQVDEWGAVMSRAEIPFHREEVALLAQIAGNTQTPSDTTSETSETAEATSENDVPTPESRIASVTVQPGNTLWGIASKRYGDGYLYVRVFDANRDQIRNPDLIYPGQIFQLPEE